MLTYVLLVNTQLKDGRDHKLQAGVVGSTYIEVTSTARLVVSFSRRIRGRKAGGFVTVTLVTYIHIPIFPSCHICHLCLANAVQSPSLVGYEKQLCSSSVRQCTAGWQQMRTYQMYVGDD